MFPPTGEPRIDDSTAEWIIGTDEAGYGSWAGDLFVGGVALSRDWEDPQVTDSKKLTHVKRVSAVKRHKRNVVWAVDRTSPEEIDRRGVWDCLILSHNKVHAKLAALIHPRKALHVVDGLKNAERRLTSGLIPLVKGDQKVPAVSLASCFAKVAQCLHMDQLHKQYPQYGFNTHRGYGGGVKHAHNQALERLGILPVHRKSYSPIKRLTEMV